jgi:class I fructose-bisphosphate aldolase
VIFSGGVAQTDETVLAEIQAIQEGGGFGSIIGRNSFQRPQPEALQLLDRIMDTYSTKAVAPMPAMV